MKIVPQKGMTKELVGKYGVVTLIYTREYWTPLKEENANELKSYFSIWTPEDIKRKF